MNYLLTQDTNLVNDMIGARVIKIRIEEKRKNNFKALMKDVFKEHYDGRNGYPRDFDWRYRFVHKLNYCHLDEIYDLDTNQLAVYNGVV